VPETPVALMPYVPVGVVDDVSIDTVVVGELVPVSVTAVGDTPQLRPSPLGTVQPKLTVPLNPATGVTVRVEKIECPGNTVAEVGDAVILKFGSLSMNTTP